MSAGAVSVRTAYATDETWLGFNGVLGGAVVAALLTGAAETVPGIAATISTHFFAPIPPGPIEVQTRSAVRRPR